MKKLMLGLFVAFGLTACSLNNDMPNSCGVYEDLAFSGYPLLANYTIKNQPKNPVSVVIDTQEKMDANFTKNANTPTNAADLTIDFTKYYLVGLIAGEKPSSGYAVKMTTIVQNSCEVVINFFEKEPQPGDPVTQVTTYPADFILIPKTVKTILFNKTTESTDRIIIGRYFPECTGSDCQTFYQINDYNIQKFLNVTNGNYAFDQYKYDAKPKRGDYTLFLKNIPSEILNLKGQTKTYGSPGASDMGGTYFELFQNGITTKVFIDDNDSPDQGTEIKIFKKAIQDKVTSLK